jgi:Leucine-rich repeat (LRR) protein
MRRLVSAAIALLAVAGALVAQDKPAEHTAAEKDAIAKLQKFNVIVLDVAQNDTHLDVSYLQKDAKFSDDYLTPLKDLKASLVSLNLRGQDVTDAQLAHLKDLTGLTRLHLENTKVTDKGLEQLKGLTNLEYLNLYGDAGVTDAGLASLEGMKKLKYVYLWQTKVTEPGAAKLKKALPQCDINLGLEAEKPPEKPAEKPKDKPKEEKKPDEKKDKPKEEKKPEEKKPEEKKPDKPKEEKKPEDKKS